MRILFYSWTPYESKLQRGGGAAAYLQRILDELGGTDEHEITHLCSGVEYLLLRRDVHYHRKISVNGVRCFEIVNSPVLAPAHLNFTNVGAAVLDSATRDVFARFLQEEGPFDIVHFNNLEGISFRVLETRVQFPGTRFVLSLHDYYPFCPQVKLWRFDRETCTDADEGRNCLECPKNSASAAALLSCRRLLHTLKATGLLSAKTEQKAALGLSLHALPALSPRIRGATRYAGRSLLPTKSPAESAALAQIYGDFSRHTARLINAHVDLVVAVSERTRDIALRHGIEPGKTVTEYIGTRFRIRPGPASHPKPDGAFTIAYLGYASREKGFDFLLESLCKLPAESAGSMRLTIAARGDGDWVSRADRHLRGRFADCVFLDGYHTNDLSDILRGVHLGIVPVLWEDNLPQVALEFVGNGVPVLTSGLGGAREVAQCPEFVFRAGDSDDFLRRLLTIERDYTTLRERFFSSLRPFPSMAEHIERLLARYAELAVQAAGATHGRTAP